MFTPIQGLFQDHKCSTGTADCQVGIKLPFHSYLTLVNTTEEAAFHLMTTWTMEENKAMRVAETITQEQASVPAFSVSTGGLSLSKWKVNVHVATIKVQIFVVFKFLHFGGMASMLGLIE